MASSCRKPSPLVFDADIAERWTTFVMDFTHYVNIVHRNDPAAVRASLLLNLAGPDAMKRARAFVYDPEVLDANGQIAVPAESADDPVCLLRKFAEICDLPSNRILERSRFFTRKQQPEEPVECFIADLRYLAQRCHFENMCDQLTRDILVTSMLDQKLRADLLQRPDLTLTQAMHACRIAEVVTPIHGVRGSDGRAVNLTGVTGPRRSQDSSRPTPRPARPSRDPRAPKCPNCNYAHPAQSQCPAFGKSCNFCKKLNHFAAACRSRGKVPPATRQILNNLQQLDSEMDSQSTADAAHDSAMEHSMGESI
ncbi:uncharacterized protein LOC129696693 [Leucoraja erinacea]|uniref:uncharacterized protein LOC129696693 n=1 Tax=Leucoraja erinaceus TaxID=7782 RepID=UPI002456E589|nr:uncharacterized protein LOC129696693 [Leucoraja erinacea]